MAGGSDKRQRNDIIPVRVTDDERNAIRAKANAAGYSVGAYLRACALGSAGPRAQRRPPVDQAVLRQLLGELGRVGNNINQIAHALNRDEAADLPELREAMTAYLGMRDAIYVALNMEPSRHDHQGR